LEGSNPTVSAQTPLRTALLLASLFATIAFLIHLLSSLWGSHLGYGFFRDELYFVLCGHHLAWGYVDQPPLVAIQARVAEMLFGLSPTGVRVLSFAAAGLMVGLTGLLCRQLGGRINAQILAMTAILAAPALLATQNYLSMNAWEPCFWMGAMLVMLRLADGTASPRAWLLFGLIAGLGIENKHSTVFFLAALFIGVLLSPQRGILWSRYCAAGVALIFLLALPNFIWQWVHQFPTYQMLSTSAHLDKIIKLPPFRFLVAQMDIMLWSTSPLWMGGLVWFGFTRKGRTWRFVALTYLVFLITMMVLHAKNYYLAPIYPVLFAAGSVAFEEFIRRTWATVTYTVILALTLVFITGEVALTVLPPDKYMGYTGIFLDANANSEKYSGPLPQILSDRFGWPEMVQGFSARYNALPPDVRAQTGIFCTNYGEASAVNILGPKFGRPMAISGHQNYYLWGWNGYTGESILTLGDKREDYTGNYAEVIDLGPFSAPWIMDFEHRHYFLLRHRKRPFSADWPAVKDWY
jgi:hypothetical protein